MWDIYMLVRYIHMTMIQIDKLTFSSDASPYLQTTTPAEFKTTTLQRSAINMSIGKNLNYIYLYWIQIWALILIFSAFIIPRCMPKLKSTIWQRLIQTIRNRVGYSECVHTWNMERNIFCQIKKINALARVIVYNLILFVTSILIS